MKISRVLITGITGSGGSYLADYIVENHPDVAVHGISRWHSTSTIKNISKSKDKIKIHECDLNDFSAVLRTLKDAKPDAIFHLAAHANVRASFDNPLAVMNNNVMGTANLFEAIRAADIDPIVQLCSTSEVYGCVDPKDVPITEECPIRPANPYAVSKLTQDALGYAYFKSYGMKVIRTRMFAYLNPRRDDLFATAFAKQIALIEAGKQKMLVHGNLDSVRTLIDVRDAMESYWVALFCKPGEVYNIGGNKVMTVGQFLEELKKQAYCPIPSRLSSDLLRPVDVTLQIPCVDKFANETGWKPRYTFEESVAMLLDYWREEVSLRHGR